MIALVTRLRSLFHSSQVETGLVKDRRSRSTEVLIGFAAVKRVGINDDMKQDRLVI